jgi:hypothetical protein
MKPIEGDGWRLQVPDGLIARPHKAWGYESGSIARGWIGDAPITVIVQKKRLAGTFNEWVREVAAWWLEQEPPRRTIRIRPEDGIGAQIEPIVDSFELVA